MERLRQHLGFGFRSLLRQPGVSLVAGLTLALGIGANLAMMSFASAMLFPSLPYDDPDRLVVIERWKEGSDSELTPVISIPALSDWQQRNRVCSDIGVFLRDRRTLISGEGDPLRLDSRLVSAGLLPTLGIRPSLGRAFSPDDDQLGAERTAMLTYELWQRQFGGDPAILGQAVRLDDQLHTVIGVLPAGLGSETLGHASLGDIWLPTRLFYDDLPVNDRKLTQDWVTVCRLKPDVSVAAAREDMARINLELAAEYPSTDRQKTIRVTPIPEYMVGGLRPVVLLLVAAVFFVLVIACANLIHVFLARSVARQREFAVRTAVGAGRRRLILQVTSEALVLTVAGGVLGLFAAALLIQVLPAVLVEFPHADQAHISPLLLVYAVLLILAVTVAIGLVPVLQTISHSWQHLLTGSHGAQAPVHRRFREVLVVGEIALAVVLLTGTGLALVTFVNLRDEDPGFSTERVVSLEIALPQSKYGEVSAWTAYLDQAIAKASAHPGVEAAAVTNTLPMGDLVDVAGAAVVAGDQPIPPIGERETTQYLFVSSDFFRALDIPLLEGRTFTSHDDDRENAGRVIILSQRLAETFWPGQTALGQKVGFEFTGTMEKPIPRWREVVGVVDDVRYQTLRRAPQNMVFVPYSQRPSWVEGRCPKMALVVKTTVDPLNLVKALDADLLAIDPDQPIHGIRTLEEILGEELGQSKMVLMLLASFAVLALLLAVVGIYGVVSYLVAARTREIALRMAVGAMPSQVLARLIRQNLVLIGIGIGIGLALAAVLSRFISNQLYGVDPLDPAIFLAGGIALALVALLATLVPAFQAARVDPSQALRYE